MATKLRVRTRKNPVGYAQMREERIKAESEERRKDYDYLVNSMRDMISCVMPAMSPSHPAYLEPVRVYPTLFSVSIAYQGEVLMYNTCLGAMLSECIGSSIHNASNTIGTQESPLCLTPGDVKQFDISVTISNITKTSMPVSGPGLQQ